MVKMNGNTLIISHLIISKSYLLLWIWLLFIFFYETSIFNLFDVVLNRLYNCYRKLYVHTYSRMIWPQRIILSLLFKLWKKWKGNWSTLLSLFWALITVKKEPLESSFIFFSESNIVKRFPSTCLFELVKLNDNIYLV